MNFLEIPFVVDNLLVDFWGLWVTAKQISLICLPVKPVIGWPERGACVTEQVILEPFTQNYKVPRAISLKAKCSTLSWYHPCLEGFPRKHSTLLIGAQNVYTTLTTQLKTHFYTFRKSAAHYCWTVKCCQLYKTKTKCYFELHNFTVLFVCVDSVRCEMTTLCYHDMDNAWIYNTIDCLRFDVNTLLVTVLCSSIDEHLRRKERNNSIGRKTAV